MYVHNNPFRIHCIPPSSHYCFFREKKKKNPVMPGNLEIAVYVCVHMCVYVLGTILIKDMTATSKCMQTFWMMFVHAEGRPVGHGISGWAKFLTIYGIGWASGRGREGLKMGRGEGRAQEGSFEWTCSRRAILFNTLHTKYMKNRFSRFCCYKPGEWTEWFSTCVVLRTH